MPAAVAVPAIAGVVGAGVNAVQGNKAAKKQQQATSEAIAFEREKEATRKAQFEQQQQQAQQYNDYRNQVVQSLAGQYGLNIPSFSGMAPGGSGMPQGAPGGGGMTLGQIAGRGMPPGASSPTMAPQGMPQGMGQQGAPQMGPPTLGNLGSWSDWTSRIQGPRA